VCQAHTENHGGDREDEHLVIGGFTDHNFLNGLNFLAKRVAQTVVIDRNRRSLTFFHLLGIAY
jgi:hypothetical protein